MFLYWIIIIAFVSVLWAFLSLRKEKNRHELRKAKEEITKGRVIYHSSDSATESSSS